MLTHSIRSTVHVHMYDAEMTKRKAAANQQRKASQWIWRLCGRWARHQGVYSKTRPYITLKAKPYTLNSKPYSTIPRIINQRSCEFSSLPRTRRSCDTADSLQGVWWYEKCTNVQNYGNWSHIC